MFIKYDLSESEREIMEVLWEKRDFMKTRDLLDIFVQQGKNWKRQTLNTFLMRLKDMDLVIRDPSVVKASCTRAEYQRRQSMEILNELYDGDVSSFCMALAGKEEISEQDKKELHALIERMSAE